MKIKFQINFSNLYLKQIYDVRKTITREFNPFFFHNAKILSKKSCYATLGKPNKKFVAFSDNKLTLLIRTIKTLLR